MQTIQESQEFWSKDQETRARWGLDKDLLLAIEYLKGQMRYSKDVLDSPWMLRTSVDRKATLNLHEACRKMIGHLEDEAANMMEGWET